MSSTTGKRIIGKKANGDYCCVPQCDNTRRNPDISLFSLPSGLKSRGYETKEWQEKFLQMLYQLRSPRNNQFKEKVQGRKAYICSAYIKDEDIHHSANKRILSFHNVHGINVELSHDKQVAKRTKSFCYGIAFSSDPIVVNEIVHIKLDRVEENWSGVIRFGVTTVDPSTMDPESLPRFACPDLTYRPGFWAKALPDELAIQNNILSFYVNKNGFLRLWVNDDDHGGFVGGIPTHLPLWVMVDIYGNTTSIRFVDDAPRSSLIYSCDDEDEEVYSEDVGVSSVDVNGTFQADVDVALPSQSGSRSDEALAATEAFDQRSITSEHNDDVEELRRLLRLPGLLVSSKVFSTKHGHGVQVIDGKSASSFHSHLIGTELSCLVFSAAPLTVGSTLHAKVLRAPPNSETLLGITSCDPQQLDVDFLPSCPMELVDREEYWVVGELRTPLRNGDFLSLTLSQSGLFHCRINDTAIQPLFFCDTTQNLWFFIDLGNSIHELRLVGESEAILSGAATSDSPILRRRSREDLDQLLSLREDGQSQFHVAHSERAIPTPIGLVREDIGDVATLATDSSGTEESPDEHAVPVNLSGDRTEPQPTRRRRLFSRRHYDGVRPRRSLRPNLGSFFSTFRLRVIMNHVSDEENSSSGNISPSQDQVSTGVHLPRSGGISLLAEESRSSSEINDDSSEPSQPCSSSVKDASELNTSAGECAICCSNTANAAIYDCGHVCMCVGCAKALVRRDAVAKCPICRKLIKDIIKLYHV